MPPAQTKAQAALPLFPDFIPHAAEPTQIQGVCIEILHTFLRCGRTIVRVRLKDGQVVVVSGPGDALLPGDALEAQGAFEVDPKYGRQFKATYLGARIPETRAGIEAYLSVGSVPGVGQRTAQRLGEAYGDTLPTIMDSIPALMAAGLAEVKARAVVEHWGLRTRHGRLISFLQSLKIGPATAKKLIEAYGEAAYGVVLTEPYRAAREVHGIGFLTADRMALSQDTAPDDPQRIQAGVLYVMQKLEKSGHCATARMELVAEASKMLVLPDPTINRQIQQLLDAGELVEESIHDRPVLFRRIMKEAEEEVASLLIDRLQNQALPGNIDDAIPQMANTIGVPPLHAGQAAAVKTSLGANTSIITGNPGTGKTSSVSVLLGMLRALHPEGVMLLAAPTGRAAQRLSEQTGQSATTIHRLLGVSFGRKGFTYSKDNPLPCSTLVVDEVSMLDVFLFRDLLRALPPTARLVLVGDVDQLPSVGAGNVLGDLIGSGAVPVGRLTKIFRQGAGSSIAQACQRINTGRMPPMPEPNPGTDFWGILTKTPTETAEAILETVCHRLVAAGFDPLRDVQVLVPGNRSDCGVEALNERLQEALNPARPHRPELIWRGQVFRIGDRVIQDENNYELEVYNGDIGFVVDVGAGGLVVDYDGRSVVYEGGALSELSLAYCITIHRSQGSEFPAVVVAVTTQHWVMLQRNLVYTAVSRARRLCCIIGQDRALATAVRKGRVRRLTGLSGRITHGVLVRQQGPGGGKV